MRPGSWFFLICALLISAPVPSQAQPTVTIAQPVQFTGRLGAENRRDRNGRRFHDYRVRLRQGERYRVSVMAARFDSMVQVLSSGGREVIAENDDSPSSQNARATFEAPRSGDYILRALGFLPEATGSYFLRIEQALPLPPPLRTERPAAGPEGATMWLQYAGSLTRDDPSLDGLHFDDYLVTLAAGEQVLVRLESGDFDPLIQVFSAADRENVVLAFDDDSGGDRNSLLLFAPGEPGDYIVRVIAWGTTTTRGFLGRYQLRIGR